MRVPKRSEAVVLAGPGEVRVVGSGREAQHALRAGFCPAVVLCGAGVVEAEAAELARALGATPECAAVPVLSASGDSDRIRLTLMSDLEAAEAAEEEQLAVILRLLDDLCAGADQLV
jgi:hypothetical protein